MAERTEGQQRSFDQPPTEGLTPEEDRELAALLGKWTGGRISTPVFTEIARMSPQAIVEVVIFRMNDGVLETLLIPRPEDDIVWPGMYHTPGAALRTADFHRDDDNPLNGPFERIQRGELGSEFKESPKFAGRLHRLGGRGPEVAEVYIAELPEDVQTPEAHIWYPAADLPNNPKFIQHQLGHVQIAERVYGFLSAISGVSLRDNSQEVDQFQN